MRTFLHIALFLTGLFGTAAVLRHHDAFGLWTYTGDRLRTFAQQHDVDTVFLGSSRVQFGVIPARFDARMAEAGEPMRSYNLGFSGHQPHDFGVMLDHVLRHRPRGLRRVVVEVADFRQANRSAQWLTDMEFEMHPLDVLGNRLRSAVTGPGSAIERGRQCAWILVHTAGNALRLGKGQRILDGWLARRRGRQIPVEPAPADRGWADIATIASAQHRREHAEWETDTAAWERNVQYVADRRLPSPDDEPFDEVSLRRQAAAITAAGLEPIFVVVPTMANDLLGRRHLARLVGSLPLATDGRPEELERLLDHRLWYDIGHVNAAGAEVLTDVLADCIRRRHEPRALAIVEPPPPEPPAPPPPSQSPPPPPAAEPAPAAPPPPPPAPPIVALPATASWQADDPHTLTVRAAADPHGGVLVAVLGAGIADHDLGNGLRVLVALPGLPLLQTSVTDGQAVVTHRLAQPATAPLYVQCAMVRDGSIVACSERLVLAPVALPR